MAAPLFDDDDPDEEEDEAVEEVQEVYDSEHSARTHWLEIECCIPDDKVETHLRTAEFLMQTVSVEETPSSIDIHRLAGALNHLILATREQMRRGK